MAVPNPCLDADAFQVYKLPLLEILDLSRNRINALPEEVSRLTSLRVLSVMQNRLDDLPAGLSEMNKLQILKVAGNPLKYPLRRALEACEANVSPSMTDNEKEVAVTAELKRYMRTRHTATTPEPEGSLEGYVYSSDLLSMELRRTQRSRIRDPQTGPCQTQVEWQVPGHPKDWRRLGAFFSVTVVLASTRGSRQISLPHGIRSARHRQLPLGWAPATRRYPSRSE